MLKVRIIPTLLFDGYGLVKGKGFDSWRRVGAALPALKVYSRRGVDELIFVDIAATKEGRCIDVAEVDHLADDCFMPLTVGGGVRSVEDIRQLLRAGADKVAVNSGAFEVEGLLEEAVAAFGSQCIVASIDARRTDTSHEVFIRSGSQGTGLAPAEAAKRVAAAGAGEILLTSVERDGTMEGYDIDLVRAVTEAVSIPVIASGGAGRYADFHRALAEGGASAVAAASIFHFTEQTPLGAKAHLRQQGHPVRMPASFSGASAAR